MKKMMMMLVMATVAMTASAQNEVGQLTLQPKIGLNLANLTNVKVISNSFTKETESGNLKGDFAIGVEAEYGVAKKFSVAAGILYSRQGTDFGTLKIYGAPDGSASEGWDKNQYNLDYLNIPIVANFYFAKGWAIKAGIQPGFLLSAKHKVDGIGATKTEDIDFKDACKTFDLSIPLGLSYEYEKAVFDLRYNLGLTKVNKNGDDSYKNSVIQFTVGYKFAL
jgi:hypothetical protein